MTVEEKRARGGREDDEDGQGLSPPPVTDRHGRVGREVMQVLQAWREAKRVAQQRAGDGVTGGDKRGARPQEVATSSRADFARQLLPPIAPPPPGAWDVQNPLFDTALFSFAMLTLR